MNYSKATLLFHVPVKQSHMYQSVESCPMNERFIGLSIVLALASTRSIFNKTSETLLLKHYNEGARLRVQ